MDFKTLSLNTRGFTQPFRDYLFHNLLFEADIFCFQEIQKSDPSFFRSFAESGGDHVFGRLHLVNKAVL